MENNKQNSKHLAEANKTIKFANRVTQQQTKITTN